MYLPKSRVSFIIQSFCVFSRAAMNSLIPVYTSLIVQQEGVILRFHFRAAGVLGNFIFNLSKLQYAHAAPDERQRDVWWALHSWSIERER